MNSLEKTRKYEKECYNFLRKKFEDVKWNSKEIPNASYDFTCYNNDIVFNVDAKKPNNKNIFISENQIDRPLFIIKLRKGKFILGNMKTLISLGYKIRITNNKLIMISDELHKQLMKEAGALQQKEGKFIGVPKLIELMLIHWRKSK